MITLPIPPVRGQLITSDLAREIIETLRRLRPISGKGILIQETMQGVIISRTNDATFQQTSAPAAWQIRQGTADANGTVTWELFSPLCSAPAGEFLPDGMTSEFWNPLPAENVSGTLYAVLDLSGETPVCTLENNPTLPIENKIAVRIGTFTTDTGTGKTTFSQDHLGVLHLGGSQDEEAPIAWQVRKNGDAWEIFAPLWITGKTERLPASMELNWNPLSVITGTLYALCAFEGSFNSDTEETTWAFKDLTLGNSIPVDTEADRYTSGLRTLAVRIGDFTTESGETTFRQIHLGVIVEDWAKGEKGDPGTDGQDGSPGAPGQDGTDGVSWSATVHDNTNTTGDGTYKITFTPSDGGASITTPNLIGPGFTADLGTQQTLTVVTDVIYDASTHQLYAKKRVINFYGSLGTESAQDIATAVAHSSQH